MQSNKEFKYASATFGDMPTPEEWDIAKSLIKGDIHSAKYNDGFKISKKSHKLLKHSFMCINGKLICLANGVLLGQGGFGKVKEVVDESGQRYALKIQSHDKNSGALETEITAATGSLKGSAVIKKANAKWDKHLRKKMKDKKYQLMELHDGSELMRVVSSTSHKLKILHDSLLPLNNRIIVAVKILEAVKMLHSVGIIHGDLKPENILINIKNGVIFVKIIDFGHSKILQSGDKVKIGKMEGTYGYMAPEVIRSGVFSEKSDLYALGVLLQSCLGLSKGAVGQLTQSMIYDDVDDKHIPTIDQIIRQLTDTLPDQVKKQIIQENDLERQKFTRTYQEYVEVTQKNNQHFYSVNETNKLIQSIKQAVKRYENNLQGKSHVGIFHHHSHHSVEHGKQLIANLEGKTYYNALVILNKFFQEYIGSTSAHSLKTLIVEEITNQKFTNNMDNAARAVEIDIYQSNITREITQFENSQLLLGKQYQSISESLNKDASSIAKQTSGKGA